MFSSRYKTLPNPKVSIVIGQKRETEIQYSEIPELVFQAISQQPLLQHRGEEQN